MNSGIVRAVKRDKCYEFFGESGSVYYCHENCWGTSGYGQGVLEYYMKNTEQAMIEVLPEDTDYFVLNCKMTLFASILKFKILVN